MEIPNEKPLHEINVKHFKRKTFPNISLSKKLPCRGMQLLYEFIR